MYPESLATLQGRRALASASALSFPSMEEIAILSDADSWLYYTLWFSTQNSQFTKAAYVFVFPFFASVFEA